MISWIPSDIDINYLVQTWKNEESNVPNIQGLVLWLTWNKKIHHRGMGGIACYIRNSISPHIQIHKIGPLNQCIWKKSSDTNAKNMHIEIYYFAPINSTFYKKNNVDNNYPYNNLEQDIYSLKNEGNILLLGDFNARIATKQDTLLSNDSNHKILWIDEDLVLSNSYKNSSKDLIENLFGTELVKLYNSQDLIVCDGVMKWPSSNQMTCIHGIGSSVVDHEPHSDRNF
jgi:hypothetical protein